MSDWLAPSLASAVVAALLLGVSCGLLGTIVVVRRMALTGDMISHAVLPGVVAGLAWSETRNPLVVLTCAVAAGVAGSAAFTAILRHTRLKPDAAMALVLSVFFALGIAMISRLQPSGVQAFLFGQVAAIDRNDLALLVVAAVITLAVVPAGFHMLRMVSFDPMFSRMIGLPVRAVQTVFYVLLTVAIVISMQAVGVVLVTAMLVTPAAAARYFTRSLSVMAVIACVFGALGGVAGVWISMWFDGLPTGPLMALAVTVVFALSALLGPRSGFLPQSLRRRRERIRIRGEDILKHLWQIEENAGAPAGRTLEELTRVFGASRHALRRFTALGLLDHHGGHLRLTDSGRQRATQLVRSHRLWERYLTERAAYKSDHVHDTAERLEHWIDEPRRRLLADQLGQPTEDPHGSPIPPDDKEVVR
jgi:manganese/zinc/iron transport system permease protein